MSPSLRAIRWRLILTSILALALALGSFCLNQWVYAPSDDQCSWQVHGIEVVIGEILPGGAAEQSGLREGDELLLIHGHRITPQDLDKAHRFINGQPEGRVLIYTVRREGQLLRLPVRLVKPFNPTSLLMLVTGLVAWFTGLLVAISSPGRKSARHFYYMGVTSLALSLCFPLGVNNLPLLYLVPFIHFGGLAAGLAGPLWLHFFLRFPHPWALRTRKRFLAAMYACSLAGAFLVMAALLIRTLEHSERLLWFLKLMGSGPVTAVVTAFLPLMGVAGVGLFWAGTLKQDRRRRRALLPVLVFTTLILAELLVYRFFLLKAAGQSLLFARGSWIYYAPLPLVPLSFAFAIFRHGFFDARGAILRWVSYFVVLGLVLAGYLGAISVLFAAGLEALQPGWAGALVGLSALPIGLLLRHLLLALRRSFRRDVSTAREVILGSLREIRDRFAERAILDQLQAALVEAYRPHLLLLVPLEEQGGLRLPPAPRHDPYAPASLGREQLLQLPARLLRRAQDYRELVVGLQSDEADWVREQGAALRLHLDALGAQVLTLIMVGGRPSMALVLGGKYAELNYSPDDRELLREVAISSGLMLDSAQLHNRLLDQGRIEQEMNTARLIQQSLVTSQAPTLAGFQVALRLVPALETGGDLLWVGQRPSGRWLAAVGDVSGKGLPAALYMSQATALVRFAAQREDLSFQQILPSLDQILCNLLGPKDFLTLSLVEWDDAGSYRAARAGHPPTLLVSGARTDQVQEIVAGGRGLGLRPAAPGQWQVLEGHIRPGEWLVMYSDGLTEAMNKDGEIFGLSRLVQRVQAHWRKGSVAAACDALFSEVAEYETQNRDDRTLFILSRNPA